MDKGYKMERCLIYQQAINNYSLPLTSQLIITRNIQQIEQKTNDIENPNSNQQMLKSRSIKLNITNNQSHISTISELSSSYEGELSVEMDKGEGTISSYSNFVAASRGGGCGETGEGQGQGEEEEDVISCCVDFDGEDQPVGGKSMFTIRQEQSYEYSCESENESACKKRNKFYQSQIDELSSIRTQNHRQNPSRNTTNKSIRQRVSQFQPQHSQKFLQNPTMASAANTRILSQQTLASHIQGWQQKLTAHPSQYQQEHQEIQQQQIITLREQQKSLKLDLMRMHRSNLVLRPDEKIRRNCDIVYNCSEEEFRQIRGILEKEGIRLVERSEVVSRSRMKMKVQKKEKENRGDREGNGRRLGFKKLKLSIISRNINI